MIRRSNAQPSMDELLERMRVLEETVAKQEQAIDKQGQTIAELNRRIHALEEEKCCGSSRKRRRFRDLGPRCGSGRGRRRFRSLGKGLVLQF